MMKRTIDSYYKKRPLEDRPGKPFSSISINAQSFDLDSSTSSSSHDQDIQRAQRLLLKASINAAKWLATSGNPFWGHDEFMDSTNQGNFIELLKLIGSYNEDIASMILENAHGNASYPTPAIQKEILSILVDKVQKKIREEIGDSRFCVIVDEAQDEVGKQQMAIILRFVDNVGSIRERFFEIVHVDYSALNLKKQICDVLSKHNLSIQNIRGQGFDGACNMRETFNGLQALIMNDCPFAYFLHCFAHILQLSLVGASKEVMSVYQFFKYLTGIIHVVVASPKRNDQLTDSRISKLEELISTEVHTVTRFGELILTEVHTITRPGDALCSLFELFDSICLSLEDVFLDKDSPDLRAEADCILDVITTFDFIFHLHLLRDVFEISSILCQSLQRKSQDILNAMDLISITKLRLQQMRDNEWDTLLGKVKSFCEKRDIDVPDMSSHYEAGKSRSRRKNSVVTLDHHYRIDVFLVVIDTQLQEISSRLKEDVVELLSLSCALDPRDGYKSFNVEDICLLANKFYPVDFSDPEKSHLKLQLEFLKLDVDQNPTLQKVSTIAELCQVLAATGKSKIYPLVDRLIRLVLTLPVSTASTERVISAMEIVKDMLRSEMRHDLLSDALVTYIEKDITKSIDVDSIIDEFDCRKELKA